MSNAKWSSWGSKPKRQPKMSSFALQWNLGLKPSHTQRESRRIQREPQCELVEYSFALGIHVGDSRWPCRFQVVYVNFVCVGQSTRTRFSVEYGLMQKKYTPDANNSNHFQLCVVINSNYINFASWVFGFIIFHLRQCIIFAQRIPA